MICFHGTILTCDEDNSVASYLVEAGGRIRFRTDFPFPRFFPQPRKNIPVSLPRALIFFRRQSSSVS